MGVARVGRALAGWARSTVGNQEVRSMLFDLKSANVQQGNPIALRCPGCRQLGTFEAVGNAQDIYLADRRVFLAHRRCPNVTCRTHVFVAWSNENGEVLVSYPAQKIDFDTTDIPPAVIAAFDEAITCHASRCFVAAAIMVRKTLEELCRDRNATGNTLKERIAALGNKVVLPKQLLDGLDALRLLGNDAAHFESQTYNQVGQQEVEVAIDFTKEVLKAVYQYKSLVQRLQALKKP
jgi:hypothetical protein